MEANVRLWYDETWLEASINTEKKRTCFLEQTRDSPKQEERVEISDNYEKRAMRVIMLFMQKMKLVKILAETGNISTTASKLNLSQSTISHHLKNLEAEVGFPLFDRVGKTSVINRDGKRFLTFADQTLREYERTLEDIKDFKSDFEPSLTVCAGNYFHAYYSPKILPLFLTMHPGVQTEMVTKYSDEIIAEMEDDEHEFAIVATSHPLRTSRLVTDFSFDIPLYFVCSQKNPS